MQRAKGSARGDGTKQRAKIHQLLFQQGGFIPLLTRAKIVAILFVFTLMITGCCAPATTANATLQETAFTATFLGFGNDGQTLLARPEQSKENVQLIYDKTLTLPVGQRVYVVGRLEGNLVYISDLRELD
jgi:hypothetical protein